MALLLKITVIDVRLSFLYLQKITLKDVRFS